jgi:hypothetical protein
MSKCPECGRENVESPAGYVAFCGRRVSHNDAPAIQFPHPDQWRERMSLEAKCKGAAAREGLNGQPATL